MPKTIKNLFDSLNNLENTTKIEYSEETRLQHLNLSDQLTPREFEIGIHIILNMNYKEISEKLFIAPSTLRKHASNIFKKAAVRGREEFQKKYQFLADFASFREDYPKIENDMMDVIDMEWKNQNSFEAYYNDFSNVIQAMYQLDFSKRLYESNDKDSFFNFVSQSINLVNDELQQKYVASEVIPKLMNSLRMKNRIVLLSMDKTKISHAFSTIKNDFIDADELIGLPIQDFIDSSISKKLETDESVEFLSEMKASIFPNYLEREAKFQIERGSNFLLISITILAENRFSEQLPRILSLLSCIKSQYDDNPALSNSVLGSTIAIEVNSIYNELSSHFIQNN